jgi:hypothetical protein
MRLVIYHNSSLARRTISGSLSLSTAQTQEESSRQRSTPSTMMHDTIPLTDKTPFLPLAAIEFNGVDMLHYYPLPFSSGVSWLMSTEYHAQDRKSSLHSPYRERIASTRCCSLDGRGGRWRFPLRWGCGWGSCLPQFRIRVHRALMGLMAASVQHPAGRCMRNRGMGSDSSGRPARWGL